MVYTFREVAGTGVEFNILNIVTRIAGLFCCFFSHLRCLTRLRFLTNGQFFTYIEDLGETKFPLECLWRRHSSTEKICQKCENSCTYGTNCVGKLFSTNRISSNRRCDMWRWFEKKILSNCWLFLKFFSTNRTKVVEYSRFIWFRRKFIALRIRLVYGKYVE